ncbi:MAG: hypothetical protein U5L96_22130 [Owenweeksia sp.]|nr:hypothetical protein [Owenweeksia sp.]
MISAQRELLQACSIRESQPALYDAAREKLRALRTAQSQIEQITESGAVQETLEQSARPQRNCIGKDGECG